MQYNTRYYSPSLGRFINRDTIGEAGGLNLYAYVGNRVPNAFDMLGMSLSDPWNPRKNMEGGLGFTSFIPRWANLDGGGSSGGDDETVTMDTFYVNATKDSAGDIVTYGVGETHFFPNQGIFTITGVLGNTRSGGTRYSVVKGFGSPDRVDVTMPDVTVTTSSLEPEGLSIGEFAGAAVTGAGEGFQKNVIDPIGTGAGLLVYTNVPGSVTLGGAYGLGGYVTVSRDSDGRVGVVGAFGYGAGAKFEVSTNTPALNNIYGPAAYYGVDVQGGARLGAGQVNAGLNMYHAADIYGNHSTVGAVTGAAGFDSTPLQLGAEVRGRLFGNVNTGYVDGEFGGEDITSAGVESGGVSAFVFGGVQVGAIFGLRPDPRP